MTVRLVRTIADPVAPGHPRHDPVVRMCRHCGEEVVAEPVPPDGEWVWLHDDTGAVDCRLP